MLQRRDLGIGREGVQEVNLKKLLGIRKKTVEMIQVLRRKPLTKNASVPELTS